jgi:hypothetical protein
MQDDNRCIHNFRNEAILKVEHFECACYSDEHRLTFQIDDDIKDGWKPEFYTSIFLSEQNNLFKRIWTALKYTFGYKCRYGHWENFIMNEKDIDRMLTVLQNYKKVLEESKNVG